jgi:hypothetical protein
MHYSPMIRPKRMATWPSVSVHPPPLHWQSTPLSPPPRATGTASGRAHDHDAGGTRPGRERSLSGVLLPKRPAQPVGPEQPSYYSIGKALQAGPNTRSALEGRVLFCSSVASLWRRGRISRRHWRWPRPATDVAPPCATMSMLTYYKTSRHQTLRVLQSAFVFCF